MYPPEYQHLLDFLDSNPEYLQDMRTRLLMPDLIALPEQFAQLVGLVTELSANFQAFAEATDRRLTSLEANVAPLQGSDLENRARLNILNIAMNEFGLTRGRILLATGRDTEPGFLATINAAAEAGLITEQQADHVLGRGHHHPRPPHRRQALRPRRVRGLAYHQAGRHHESTRPGRHGRVHDR